MVWGTCIGSFGIGSCGSASSSASTTIANTIIAKALRQNIFKCQQKTNAGQKVVARGCSCDEMGLPTIQCSQYKLETAQNRHEICDALAPRIGKDITADQFICFCTAGSCNLDVSQTNDMFIEADCTSVSNARQNITNNLSNDVGQLMKQMASDFGQLLDTSDQSTIANASNNIQQSMTDTTIKNIQSAVTNPQTVTASCNGVNIGITQRSQLNQILRVVSNDTSVQQARNDLQSVIQQKLTRKNNGFTGWLTGTIGTIVIVIVAIIVLCIVIFVLYRMTSGNNSGAGSGSGRGNRNNR